MSSYISLYSIHIYLPICLYVYIFIPDIHYPNCNRYAKLNRPNANPGGFPASSQSGRMQGFPQGLALGGNTIHRRYWQIAEYNSVFWSRAEHRVFIQQSRYDNQYSLYTSLLYIIECCPPSLGISAVLAAAPAPSAPLFLSVPLFSFFFFLSSCRVPSFLIYTSLPFHPVCHSLCHSPLTSPALLQPYLPTYLYIYLPPLRSLPCGEPLPWSLRVLFVPPSQASRTLARSSSP